MAGDVVKNCNGENRKSSYPTVTDCATHPTHAESLIRGLNMLRNADKLFDVSLIVEGRTFKAHRVVLAACSDYFCAMFTDAMRESRQNEISLEGVSARGIELVLEFIYTAKLKLDDLNIQDVLSVSTHIQMQDIIDACSNYLESQIDLENCVSIATLAELYSLDLLKKRSYQFICSHLSEFGKTSDLTSLTLDQMEFILSCDYAVDCHEEIVLEITLKYCLSTKLNPELVRQLVTKIRFDEIDTSALEKITHELTDVEMNKNSYINIDKDNELCKLIRAEKLKQDNNCLDIREKPTRDIVINSRGMELTLVKIGGFEPNGLTNEISCYLTSKRKWEMLTVIPHIEQCNYGTAVLGNELFVVGGSYDVSLKGYTHPFGFRYCPTKNKWRTMAPIQGDRCLFSLNALGKKFLYAVGGLCELNDGDIWGHEMLVTNCERYDVAKDVWEYMPSLAENRSQHAGVVIGDKLYISGGINRHIVLATLWCFDTKTENWSKLNPMPTPRADHVLIALDGKIYACGGWYEDNITEMRVLAETIDVYDVERNVWTNVATNPAAKFYTGVAAVGYKLFYVGGLHSTAAVNRATSVVQCFDLETKTWSTKTEWEYPQEVWECTCTAMYVPSELIDLKFYSENRKNDCDNNGVVEALPE